MTYGHLAGFFLLQERVYDNSIRNVFGENSLLTYLIGRYSSQWSTIKYYAFGLLLLFVYNSDWKLKIFDLVTRRRKKENIKKESHCLIYHNIYYYIYSKQIHILTIVFNNIIFIVFLLRLGLYVPFFSILFR